MTGTIGSTAVISNFSLALLRDSGLVKYPEVFIINLYDYPIFLPKGGTMVIPHILILNVMLKNTVLIYY